MIATPDQILAFWRAAGPDKWFEVDDVIDGEIRARFVPTYEAAAGGTLNGWQETRDGTLALLVLLDQFPRNLFRGEARAYATDPQARAIADRAISRGIDREFPIVERQFFYLPFMHSEDLADQERCIALCGTLKSTRISSAGSGAFLTGTARSVARPPSRNKPFSTVAGSAADAAAQWARPSRAGIHQS
jgi:uncharacterized protein (DUF924 family)